MFAVSTNNMYHSLYALVCSLINESFMVLYEIIREQTDNQTCGDCLGCICKWLFFVLS